jgi:5S rRNA maturation endonuclease (ribonuclease M5)
MRKEMREKQAFLELKNLVENMNEDVTYVIVEGRKDKEALRKLGYKGKIVYANKLKRIKEGKVVILTDFDKEGIKIAERIKKEIGERKIDEFFREKVGRILKSISRNDIQSISNLCRKYKDALE